VTKRYARKRRPPPRPPYETVADPKFHRDMLIFAEQYRALCEEYGVAQVKSYVEHLTAPPPPDPVLTRKIVMVERLLRLNCSRYEFAKLLVVEALEAESELSFDTAKGQINDALAAVRQMQADEGPAAILELGDDTGEDDRPLCRHGVLFIT
jgi:hypothetical protein